MNKEQLSEGKRTPLEIAEQLTELLATRTDPLTDNDEKLLILSLGILPKATLESVRTIYRRASQVGSLWVENCKSRIPVTRELELISNAFEKNLSQ